jgi:hypothetical protein
MKKSYTLFKIQGNGLKCILLLLTVIAVMNSPAQKKLAYDVIKNGNIIGNINFVEFTKDQKKFQSLTSSIESRFIFSFSDHIAETAAYDNGVMIYSSFYRNQDGSEKTDKKTIAAGDCYELLEGGALKSITCNPIRYNTLLLFNNIPENINKVYSGNYQKLLEIKKVKANQYRLSLPDGNYNYYTYTDGVCSRVDIERTYFKLQFILRKE